MPTLVELTFPEPDLARLTFGAPGERVNLLDRETLAAIAARLGELGGQTGVAGLIVASVTPDVFFAGADVHQFAERERTAEEVEQAAQRGQTLFRKFAELPFPTVAMIDGVCVGGGLELALWCDRRVVARSPRTELGFPEVKLGICPGWGGLSLAPRAMGLAKAVELLTTGEFVSADDAKSVGLVDDVAPREALEEAAMRILRAEIASRRWRMDRERRLAPLTMAREETEFLAATAGAMIARESKGRYPAPPTILESLLATASTALDEALALEAKAVARLFVTPERVALTNVFLITDRAKKETAAEQVSERVFRSPALVGAGVMGIGIASAHAKHSLSLTIVDQSPEALARGVLSAAEEAAYDKRLRRVDPTRVPAAASRFVQSTRLSALEGCDLVIEATLEDATAKKKLLAELERIVAPDAVLATNTSTIPIGELAKALQRPERLCGMHFFNPVRRMRVVEIVRGAATSPETIAAAARHVRLLGKMPILAGDRPGFVVNRVLSPYLGEAMALLSEGQSIVDIDRAAVRFGMPLGPFALYDLVGIDTSVNAGKVMWLAFPGARFMSPVLPAMLKRGRLGRKNGQGFYDYRNKRGEARPDPAVDTILETYAGKRVETTPEDMPLRLFLPMVLEATRVLDEGLVSDPRDIDLGVVYGLGLSPHTGGILHWADRIGAPQLLAHVERFAPLGERWKPTQRLIDMARTRTRFYGA